MKYVNFCLIVIGSLILSSGSIKTDKPSLGYHPGEQIPNIVLKDVEGHSLNLSDYKGKKVMINFWAVYDAQSRVTNIQLHNYLKQNYPDISLVSISFDANKSVFEKTILWDQVDKKSQFCDVNGTNSSIYKEFKLEKGFKNYLIDENGVITAMNVTPQKLKNIL